MSSRERILNRIKIAEKNKNENSFSLFDTFDTNEVFYPLADSLENIFSEELQKVSGKYHYCQSIEKLNDIFVKLVKDNDWNNIFCLEHELQEKLKKSDITFLSEEQDFLKTEIGIVKAELLVARYGCAIVSSAQISGRRLNVYPSILVIVGFVSQLLPDLKDAIVEMKKKYSEKLPSQITFITGPSRTADIEKTLVLGAHGPKELHVILVNDKIIS